MFRGHIPLSSSEKEKLFSEATIVLDTNVLLDMYRYRYTTSQLFLNLLGQTAERLWLPHHVGYEFFKNRATVRAEATKNHDERIQLLEEFKPKVDTRVKRSHLEDDEQHRAFISNFDAYLDHLRTQRDTIDARSKASAHDEFLEKILALYDERVGDEPDKAWLDEAMKEGRRRVAGQIPPGFKDGKKEDNEFGDYYIWQQTMDYAKKQGVDIVLVTGDVKSDWWLSAGGRKLGPLPALLEEFQKSTNQRFLMYTSQSFFDILATNYKQSDTSDEDVSSAKEDIAEVSGSRSRAEQVMFPVGIPAPGEESPFSYDGQGTPDNIISYAREVLGLIQRAKNEGRPWANAVDLHFGEGVYLLGSVQSGGGDLDALHKWNVKSQAIKETFARLLEIRPS